MLALPAAAGSSSVEEAAPHSLAAAARSAMANRVGELSAAELREAELSPEDVPEMYEIDRTAGNRPVNRLREQEEALNVLQFQNRDGTRSMLYYGNNIKYLDENGQAQDKSNRLEAPAQTDDVGEDYAYTNPQNDIHSYFPERLSTEKGVLLTDGEWELEMRPDTAEIDAAYRRLEDDQSEAQTDAYLSKETAEARQVAETGRIAADVEPVVLRAATEAEAVKSAIAVGASRTADAVDYAQVFGENTAVRYKATFDGVKEEILLLQKPEANRYAFVIKTGGLRMELQNGVGILSDPVGGEERAFASPLTILDGNGADQTAGWAHAVELETVVENEEYRYTIVVDSAFLNAPETVYPVTVDPTVEYINSSSNTYIKVTQLWKQGSTYSKVEDVNMVAIGYDLAKIGRAMITFPGLTNMSIFQNMSNAFDGRLYVYDADASYAEQVIECHTNTVSASSSAQTIWNAVGDSTWQGDTGFSRGGGSNGPGGSGSGDWYFFTMGPAVASWYKDHNQATKGVILKQFDEYDNDFNAARYFYTPKQSYSYMSLKINYKTYGDLGWSYVLPTSHRTISQQYHSGHLGIDLADSSIDGQPIYSACAGTVVHISTDDSMGNAVVIESDCMDIYGHITIRYLHMKYKPLVSEGQQVDAGTMLGYVGNTGDSHGSHLHLDMNNLGSWNGPTIREHPERTINPVLFFPHIF